MVNPAPAQAVLNIVPSPLNANLTECIPYSVTFTRVDQTCPGGPFTYFFWLAGAPPAWVSLDMNTGKLTACPPLGSAGVYNFSVGITELWMGPVPPPCAAMSPASNVTLTVAAAPVPAPLTIIPTYYYTWSMENMPFYLPLAATGCSGNYTWSASGLPLGLSVTDNVGGVISGIPAPGTAGIYTVTVNVADTTLCDNCCPPTSRPFLLAIDPYALYISGISYSAFYDFNVQIGTGLGSGVSNVLVDGDQKVSLMGGQSASFTSYHGESHLVTVDKTIVVPDPGTRYSVIGSNQLLVNELNSLAYFDYAKEVLIETASDPAVISQPHGTGFYAIGGYFTSTANGPEISGTQDGTKYVFREWSLPDGSTNPNRDMAFIVSYTGTTTAKYDTFYRLNIESNDPSYNESLWALKDSTAQWNVALQPVPMPNFWGTIGGVMRPVNASGSHVMTGPYTQKIEWYQDYTVPTILIVISLLIIAGIIFYMARRKSTGIAHNKMESVATTGAATTVVTVPLTTPVTAADEKKAIAETVLAKVPNFCPKCGAPVEKDAVFCKKCGEKLVNE